MGPHFLVVDGNALARPQMVPKSLMSYEFRGKDVDENIAHNNKVFDGRTEPVSARVRFCVGGFFSAQIL